MVIGQSKRKSLQQKTKTYSAIMSSLKKLKEVVVAARKDAPKKSGRSSMLSTEYVEETDAEDDSDGSDSSSEIAPDSISIKTNNPTVPDRKGLNGSALPKASTTAPKAVSVASSDSESNTGSESESTHSSGSEDSSSDSAGDNKGKGSGSVTTNSATATGAKR